VSLIFSKHLQNSSCFPSNETQATHATNATDAGNASDATMKTQG